MLSWKVFCLIARYGILYDRETPLDYTLSRCGDALFILGRTLRVGISSRWGIEFAFTT